MKRNRFESSFFCSAGDFPIGNISESCSMVPAFPSTALATREQSRAVYASLCLGIGIPRVIYKGKTEVLKSKSLPVGVGVLAAARPQTPTRQIAPVLYASNPSINNSAMLSPSQPINSAHEWVASELPIEEQNRNPHVQVCHIRTMSAIAV
eukprot:g9139.t1